MTGSDTITIRFLLVIIGVLLLLVVLSILDNIIQKTSSVKGSANIVRIDKLDSSDYLITYSYFNEFKEKEYVLKKTIDKKSFESIKGQDIVEIEYVSYFPKTPRLAAIESNTPLVLLILGLAVIVFSFYRTVLAARGKITLAEFIGVNRA